MNKTIMILVIAGAFVAGMFVSGTNAVAQGIGTSPGLLGQVLTTLQEHSMELDSINDKLDVIDNKLDSLIGTSQDIELDVEDLGFGQDEIIEDTQDIQVDLADVGAGIEDIDDKLDQALLDLAEIKDGGVIAP